MILIFSPDKTLLMNGDLNVVHAELEADCSACHAPWHQVQSARCVDCHQVDLAMTTHETVPLTCSDCHIEHQGRGAPLWNYEVTQCMDCHVEYVETKLHPGRGGECFQCHGQHLTIDLPERGISDLIFSHDTHLRRGGLVEAVCSDCHTPDPEGVNLMPPAFGQCSGCHFESPVHDTSLDIATGQGCVYCHSLDRVTLIKSEFAVVASFREARQGVSNSRFSHADHLPFDCETCHRATAERTNIWEISLPGMDSCLNCH